MTREELIKNVALKMDEISSSDDVIVDVDISDNNPLYTQINKLLNESINEALVKAPVHRIGNAMMMNGGPYTEKDTTYAGNRTVISIPLPDDFLRLASIDSGKFQRPIVALATDGDEVSNTQRNKFLVAKYAKPVGVLCVDGASGGKCIKCYSFDPADNASVIMTYIPRFNEELGLSVNIKIDTYLSDIVSWICAGKVYSSRGDAANSKICDENALALMV